MESRIYNVNLQSGYNTLTYIGISQYDAGVPLQFNVYDGAVAASFPAGTTAKIQGVRPSGVGFDISCTLTDNVVTVDTSTDMTGEAGKFPVEIRFTASGVDVGTVNFMFIIEKAPHPDGTIDADITRQATFIERLEAVEDDKVPFPETNKYGTAGQVLSTHGDGTTEWISGGASGDGLTDEIKEALLQVARKVVYVDEHGQDYYNDLHDALYPPAPPATLLSITAVYTQSGTVYDTDSLDVLRDDLVVTGHYNNGTSAPISAYELSGTLTEGTSTITVSYGGKTDTFSVTVSSSTVYLYNWDFTQGLTDSVQGITATLGGTATQDATGVHLYSTTDYVKLGQILGENRAYEIEVGAVDASGWASTLGARIFSWYNGNKSGVAYDPTAGNWTIYDGTWNTPQTVEAAKDFFANSKLKVTTGAGSSQWKRMIRVYKDGTEVFSKDSNRDIVTAANYAYIGAETNSMPGLTVKSLKVYALEG